MPHEYKNYAHFEGVLDQDAVLSSMPEGMVVCFKLSVREVRRDENGEFIKLSSIFHIEVEKENSKFAASLRKGTPVFIDAGLRIRTTQVNGMDQEFCFLKAHRVYTLDFASGKKGAYALETTQTVKMGRISLHDYKNYAHLEGILDQDATLSETTKGITANFRLSVREASRNEMGEFGAAVFKVEVGRKYSKFAASLRKGTRVFIDASLRIRSTKVNGVDREDYVLKAHRVYALDSTN